MKYYLQKIGKSYYKCWYTKDTSGYIKHRQTLGPISKSLADEIIRKINEDIIRNRYNLAPRDRSFNEFVEEFKKFRQTLPLKTQLRDAGIIKKFTELTNISYVSEFNLKLVETYIGQRKAQNPNLRNASVNKELNTLSMMSKKMKHWHYTDRNVLEDLQRLPEQEVIPKFFTDNELQQIFKNFTSGWLTMAYLGYYCGLRLEEAVAATIDNVIWDTHTLILVASKTGKERGIPLAAPIYNYLLDLKNKHSFIKDKNLVQFPKAEIKKYPVETDTVDFQVEWKLSNNEIEDLKKQRLENLDKIDELAIKKKQMQDDFKTQIKQLTIENYKLRATIKKGVEIRTAQCVCNYDYDEGTRTVYHPQTNEVIEKRELTNEERQMEFK